MPYLTYLALSIGISYSLLVIIQRAKTHRAHARHAAALGCKPAHFRKHKLPFGIDHVLRLMKADSQGQIPDEVEKIFKEQKRDTISQVVFGTTQLTTTNPRNIQALLATQFQDFELGHIRRQSFIPMLGHGIFTSDGQAWNILPKILSSDSHREHSRALLRPQFNREQVADLNLEETHIQQLLKQLPIQSGWTAQIDLSPLFFRLTIDSATEFLFGQSIQSQLSYNQGYKVQGASEINFESLAHAFDRGTAAIGIRARLSALYWLHNPKQFRDDCKEVNNFADYYVNRVLQQPEDAVEEDKGRYVFLRELAKTTKDPVELRSQLLNILLAGRDTTAGLLGWVFWNLARNPAIYSKLRTSITEEFGEYDSPRAITFASLKACTYLQYVMKETLRLFPSVPLNVRQAVRDTTLPVGGGPDGTSPVFVPAGQEVAYTVYVMQRREDIWGPDAAIFNPDRWVDKKAGWEYLPFNGGPRICIGQQFALTEVGYVLTRLIQKFDKLENCDELNVPIHQYSVTSAPKQVLVRLHEAR